jgi:hypothetical protein
VEVGSRAGFKRRHPYTCQRRVNPDHAVPAEIALHGGDVGVVDKAVDHGCGDGDVAGLDEDLGADGRVQKTSPQRPKGLLLVTIRLARS